MLFQGQRRSCTDRPVEQVSPAQELKGPSPIINRLNRGIQLGPPHYGPGNPGSTRGGSHYLPLLRESHYPWAGRVRPWRQGLGNPASLLLRVLGIEGGCCQKFPLHGNSFLPPELPWEESGSMSCLAPVAGMADGSPPFKEGSTLPGAHFLWTLAYNP